MRGSAIREINEAGTALDVLDRALAAAEQLGDMRVWLLISELAGVCDVVLDEGISTACIRSRAGGSPQIAFNPRFVQAYLEDDDAVLFVLLHEIMHRVHGDLVRHYAGRGNPTIDQLANLVFDIHINSTLCEQFWPRGLSFLAEMYDKDDPLLRMLLPPVMATAPSRARVPAHPIIRGTLRRLRTGREALDGLLREWGVAEFAARFGERGSAMAELGVLWSRAWLQSIGAELMIEELARLLDVQDQVIVPPLLLGDHDGMAEGDGEGGGEPTVAGVPIPKWLRDAMARGDGGPGFPGGFIEEREELAPLEDDDLAARQAAERLRRDVERMIEFDLRGTLPTLRWNPRPSVVPQQLDRRAVAWLAAGHLPVIQRTMRREAIRSPFRLNVYVDVSGSTRRELPRIFSLVQAIEDLVGDGLWQFSNKVMPMTLDDLKAGRFRTTGGTDLGAVLAHAREHRLRRILIISDGCFGHDAGNVSPPWHGDLFMILTDLPYLELDDELRDMLRGVWCLGSADGSIESGPLTESDRIRRRFGVRRRRADY